VKATLLDLTRQGINALNVGQIYIGKEIPLMKKEVNKCALVMNQKDQMDKSISGIRLKTICVKNAQT